MWNFFIAPSRMERDAALEAAERQNRLLLDNQDLRRQLDKESAQQPLSIVFDNEYATRFILGAYSSYHVITTPLVHNKTISKLIGEHEFWFNIHNNQHDKTIHNVRVVLTKVSFLPSIELHRQFVPRDRSHVSLDVHPGSDQQITLGYGIRQMSVPGAINFMDEVGVNHRINISEKNKHVGFTLILRDGNYDLPRQDDITLDISVFADNIRPCYGRFRLNLEDGISVAFEPLDSLI